MITSPLATYQTTIPLTLAGHGHLVAGTQVQLWPAQAQFLVKYGWLTLVNTKAQVVPQPSRR